MKMETPAVLLFLKETKNAVIGNPKAKADLHQEGVVDNIVRYVNASSLFQAVETTFPDEIVSQIRIEAANVLTSLSRGEIGSYSQTLPSNPYNPYKSLVPIYSVQGIIAAGVPTALLTALRDLRPNDPENLRISLVRALRAVCVAVSESACTFYDLPDHDIEMRSDARAMLDYLFQDEALAIYLPFLEDPSFHVQMLIAELLAFSVRVKKHRTSVTQWMPPDERTRTKGKRGWEMSALVDAKAPSRQGGWVVRHLTSLLKSKESKVVEASLWAICALVDENTEIAHVLKKSPTENRTQTISTLIFSFSKDRNTSVRLAACQCSTNIIRATSPDRSQSVTLLHVLTTILSSDEENDDNRVKACKILSDLVKDDHNRCLDAYKSGSLIKVCDLIKAITPTEKPQEWEDGEAKGTLHLREAALMALASLALLDNNIRTEVTDKLGMLPRISLCLSHPHAGTRFAACNCIRSLSRAVQVLRTAILDSGVSEILCKIVEDKSEDKRVTNTALAAMSNLVMNFSPLRKSIMERGLLSRIAELCRFPEDNLKLSALWTVKNLVNKATKDEKLLVMNHVGWDQLLLFMRHPKDGLREQALNILCNIASNEDGIDMIFDQLSKDQIIGAVVDILDSENEDDDVVCQAINILANIANGRLSHKEYIVNDPRLLSAIRGCMTHPMEDVRLAAVSCTEQLASKHAIQLREAKIDVTLGHIVRSNVHGLAQSPTVSSSRGLSSGVESSQEVREKARNALRRIEEGEDYPMASS